MRREQQILCRAAVIVLFAEAGYYTAFPMGFALGSRLWEAGEVLVQSLSLAHFGPVHLLAESPGCNSVEVSCQDGNCDVQ